MAEQKEKLPSGAEIQLEMLKLEVPNEHHELEPEIWPDGHLLTAEDKNEIKSCLIEAVKQIKTPGEKLREHLDVGAYLGNTLVDVKGAYHVDEIDYEQFALLFQAGMIWAEKQNAKRNSN